MPRVLKRVNALPVPTWRRLGVNGASIITALPEPSKGVKKRHSPLPAGTSHTSENVLKCAEFPSALSSELATFVRVHSNAGMRFRISRGVHVDAPLVYNLQSSEAAPNIFDDNVIYAEANSSVTLVLDYSSADESLGYHMGLTRVLAENCAEVKIVEIQRLNDKSANFSDFSAVLANGASCSHTRIILGAKESYSGSHIKLEGDRSALKSEVFYLGSGEQKLDFNYISRHLGQNTESELNCSGVLLDSCDKIFRCTIDFAKGAGNSIGSENENTLLLSGKARNRTAPLILCGEENVQGSHSASVGKPDEAKLYYMQSKGFSQSEAIRMMATSMLSSSLKDVPLDNLRKNILNIVESKI